MKTKALFYLTTAGLLAACGGSNDGSAVNPTVEAPIAGAPIVINKVELTDPDNAEAVTNQIEMAEPGDSFDIPASTLFDAPEAFADVEIELTVGDTLNGTSVYYVTIPAVPDANFLGDRGIFAMSSFANSLGIDEDDLEVTYTNIAFDADRNVNIQSVSGINDYRSLEAGADDGTDTEYVDASIVSYTVEGQKYYENKMNGTGSTFTSPVGSYNYSGRAAVAWDDGSKLASGSVTMSASFGAASSSAVISASELAGEDATAAFTGTVNIDNEAGTFSSTSATITTNGSNAAANILGIFNSDATLTAGTVFDSATTGRQAAGVFSMSRD
jgi:hypothetical protein